ncbi:MAG: hypothetical protein CMP37_03660 [Rickettsiales bacterium]|nr:hypothetical protein [Rickettsiales bacterium]|tara:strand:- start:3394 stop:5433 length:2040 start_codon:yes stop_codon:yes gene_type:complete
MIMTKNNPLKRVAASGASDRSDAAIYDLLGYNAIAKAGQPVSLTGESVIQLGALIAQMDFDDPLEEEVAEDSSGIGIATVGTGEDYTSLDEYKLKTFPPVNTNIFNIPDLVSKSKKITTTKPNDPPKPPPSPPQNQGEFGTLMPELPSRTFTKNPNPGTEVKQKGDSGVTPVGAGGGVRLKGTTEGSVRTRSIGEIFSSLSNYFFNEPANDDKSKKINNSLQVGIGLGSSNKRLSDETLSALEGLRYYKGKFKDTPFKRVMHAVQTPFLQTDGLQYGQIRRAVMPEYAKGRLGSAAAEGFNLVADSYNYAQSVKAEYDKDLDDEFGNLEVDVTFTNDQAREDYLSLALEKKKRLSEGFNSYARGKMSKLEYENLKSSLVSEIQAAAGARNNLTQLRKEFQDNKDNYDINGSDPKITDFYNTLDKNPERLSIKTKEGIDYITGTTLGGKPISVPTNAIANGTAGFRLVQKESLDPIISGAGNAIDQFNKGKEYVKTEYGIGTEGVTADKAKEIGINYIKSALVQDKTKARTYMSQIGVDFNAYEQFMKQGNLPDDFLTDAATELYEQRIAPFYQQQTQTTRFATQRQPSRGSAVERTQKQMLSKYNATGLPTASNILDYSIDVLGGKDFEVRELEDGTYGVFKQGKPDQTLSILDLNKPEQAKRILFNYGGLKPYSLPTK